MLRSRAELVWAGLICLGVAGCRSGAPTTTAGAPVGAGPGQSAVSAQSKGQSDTVAVSKPVPKQPFHYERPPVEQDSTAGVRGTQMVEFVVTDHGKPVEGAHVSIVNAKGRSEGDGTTDDWGEFHTGLSLGRYRVKVSWQGADVRQDLRVDEHTQEIDLKVDARNP